MQSPWSNYFRLGLVHFMAYPEVAADESRVMPTLAAVAADADFEVVEMKGVANSALRKQIREFCQSAHLSVAYGAQPLVLGQKLNPNSLDATERNKAMQVLKAAVDEAGEMGAEGFALLSGPDPGEAGRKAAFAALADFLAELSLYAQKVGNLQVILEVFDRDIDKKALIGPHKLAAELAATVCKQAPGFGLMVDLSHLPLLNETAEQALQAVREYLVHAHAGNCVMRDRSHAAYGDLHPRFGVPGGENDVDELADYLTWLFKTGYLGGNRERRPILSFEIKPMAGEESASVIAGAKRTLTAAWAKVRL